MDVRSELILKITARPIFFGSNISFSSTLYYIDARQFGVHLNPEQADLLLASEQADLLLA